jgi:hypothetical protein
MKESNGEKISMRIKGEIISQLAKGIKNAGAKQQKGSVYLADCDDIGAFYFERLNILKTMEKDGVISNFSEVTKKDEMKQWSDLEVEQDPEVWFEYKESFSPEERRFAEVIFNTQKILKLAEEQESIIAIKKLDIKNLGAFLKTVHSKSLKSIYLIANSVAATGAIFLVLDERFNSPIRRESRNNRGGETFIKKLHNIAYFVDAPDKRVPYKKNLASDINSGLFRIRPVNKYMKTNRFKKPTLVQKSENNTLVLKNEIMVKTGTIDNDVPLQYQYLYNDKTK